MWQNPPTTKDANIFYRRSFSDMFVNVKIGLLPKMIGTARHGSPRRALAGEVTSNLRGLPIQSEAFIPNRASLRFSLSGSGRRVLGSLSANDSTGSRRRSSFLYFSPEKVTLVSHCQPKFVSPNSSVVRFFACFSLSAFLKSSCSRFCFRLASSSAFLACSSSSHFLCFASSPAFLASSCSCHFCFCLASSSILTCSSSSSLS